MLLLAFLGVEHVDIIYTREGHSFILKPYLSLVREDLYVIIE